VIFTRGGELYRVDELGDRTLISRYRWDCSTWLVCAIERAGRGLGMSQFGD